MHICICVRMWALYCCNDALSCRNKACVNVLGLAWCARWCGLLDFFRRLRTHTLWQRVLSHQMAFSLVVGCLRHLLWGLPTMSRPSCLHCHIYPYRKSQPVNKNGESQDSDRKQQEICVMSISCFWKKVKWFYLAFECYSLTFLPVQFVQLGICEWSKCRYTYLPVHLVPETIDWCISNSNPSSAGATVPMTFNVYTCIFK